MTSVARITSPRMNKRLRMAKAHRYYSLDDVIALYSVSSNTVGNWRNAGLPSIKASIRLFRGEELNAFHKRRKLEAKCPCTRDEIYCVCCKTKHSLLEEPYKVDFFGKLRVAVVITCPDTGGTARKFISQGDLDHLQEFGKPKSSPENRDYSASLVPAEIGDLAQAEESDDDC